MNQTEPTSDGGFRPKKSPDCPKCGYDVTESNARAPRDLFWYVKQDDCQMLQKLFRPRKGFFQRLFAGSPPEVDPRNNGGFTPLMHAAIYGNTEAARILLDNGADVNAETSRGQRAVDLARWYHHPEVESLLQERGGKPSDDK